MGYPATINNLIECFRKLPGIGEKSAERMALSLLNLDDDIISFFAENILAINTKIKRCKICNNFSEDDYCEICKDSSRNCSTLCIVEEPKNIITLEKFGVFNGKYHVLGGLISPLDGITPEDINISNIVERVKRENIKEVVIAVKPSVEGETTARYISKILSKPGVTISKIAHGVPIGADMDYLDALTLELAFDNRTQISE
ncbi:MAG: recombination mediator RecR [Clostridium sp.]|nr:recombination mediator RecR [Clostridium sp.]MCM1443779.1 recombination mediator RecR [Candidatus Amulumruptor caecigallinarius]